jgi:delta 1-pyrroline-5-carboxylate dehydrogenase
MDLDAQPIAETTGVADAAPMAALAPTDERELLSGIQETRLDQLVSAIPLIAQLPEWSFISARKLLRRRLAEVSFEQRQRFEIACRHAASNAGSDVVRNRIDSLIA